MAENSRAADESLKIRILLVGLTAFGPVSTDLYLPSLPALIRAFETDVSQVQLTLSAFLLGFASMQLVYGPLSDRFGRRPVLLAGILLYFLASVACLAAASIEALILGRFVQAMGAACGPVLGRAIVRDIFGKDRAAKVLSYMASAMALAPAVAPILGGWLETGFGWRANFLALVAFGAIILFFSWRLLGETNKHKDRDALHPLRLFGNYRRLLADRHYIGYVLTLGFAFSALFSFISGSSFVLIDVLKVSPQGFGLCFAAVVAGYIAGALGSGRVSQRMGVDRILGIAVWVGLGAALLLNGSVAAGWVRPDSLPGVAALILPMSLVFLSCGMILPNGMAGAIGPFPQMAGAASSLLGFLQMGLGAFAGFLVGKFHDGSAQPMALSILINTALALIAFRFLVRRRPIP